MTTFEIKYLTTDQQNWLNNNVGPRLYTLHNQIGGKKWKAVIVRNTWLVSFEDERDAVYFSLRFL